MQFQLRTLLIVVVAIALVIAQYPFVELREVRPAHVVLASAHQFQPFTIPVQFGYRPTTGLLIVVLLETAAVGAWLTRSRLRQFATRSAIDVATQ